MSAMEDAVFIDWISQVLVNDEASTDEELVKLFHEEGKLEHESIAAIMRQRDEALRNPLTFVLNLDGIIL